MSLIQEDLLEILACPACKGRLEVRSEPPALLCRGCRKAYPVRDGIPVLLIEEAEGIE